MRKIEIISRVKKFINKFVSDQFEEDGEWVDNNYVLDDYYKPYYLILNCESHGYFQQVGDFYSKKDLDDLILSQIREISYNGSYNRWDNIYIFHIKKNKLVTPKFSLR